jgi:beta-arabinofuranosyltransferase
MILAFKQPRTIKKARQKWTVLGVMRYVVPLSLVAWAFLNMVDVALSYFVSNRGAFSCCLVTQGSNPILLPSLKHVNQTPKSSNIGLMGPVHGEERCQPCSSPFVVDLPQLLQKRALDDVVVLVGFNFGYRNMFFNLLCQFRELGVRNYAVAAFDVQAYALCLTHDLPCFPVTAAAVDPSTIGDDGGSFDFYHSSSPQLWDTVGFNRMTKLKSRQVLRVLQLGYDVLWTDVDVFWKRDPLPDIRAQLGTDAHIGIQTDALWGTDANSWLNSGFYYVKSSNHTLGVFADIVKDSESNSDSEQPSFNRVLCQSLEGTSECRNDLHEVLTRALDRERYVHGAVHHIIQDVTKASKDDVVMVHFNYRAGRKDKETSLKENGLWLLGSDCLWNEEETTDTMS